MADLSDKLTKSGFAFDFFQAVRLLEQANPDSPPVGGPGPYDQEAVRLRPNHSLGFPPGDVDAVERLDGERELWRVTQNFMGLYGVESPLPPYFAEMVAQGYLEKDPLREFLDIFNHRAVSLYYRAWKKNRLAAQIAPQDPDTVTLSLCAALGEDDPSAHTGWAIPPHRLLRYFSILSSGIRPAASLESMVSDYFGITGVKVRQLLPRSFRLQPHELSLLGDGGSNQSLGDSFVLGERVMDWTGQFRLSLGPLDQGSFLKLQPGEPEFAELVFLVKLFVRNQLDFDLELILENQEVQPMRLSAREPTHALGRNSWVAQPLDHTVSTLIYPEPQ